MKKEYRIQEYSGKYYLEELKSQGVWKIIEEYNDKAEADDGLKEFMI